MAFRFCRILRFMARNATAIPQGDGRVFAGAIRDYLNDPMPLASSSYTSKTV